MTRVYNTGVKKAKSRPRTLERPAHVHRSVGSNDFELIIVLLYKQ